MINQIPGPRGVPAKSHIVLLYISITTRPLCRQPCELTDHDAWSGMLIDTVQKQGGEDIFVYSISVLEERFSNIVLVYAMTLSTHC